MDRVPSRSRRALLAGATGAIGTTSGCLGEIQNLVGRKRTGQLSLTIATLPAADDPYAIRIATMLADNLAASGIDTAIEPMSPDVLFRRTLINHDFDIYVAGYPSQNDPDELRSLLYSTYAEESGWQNPFGYTDLTFDDLLDEQRTVSGKARVDIAEEIQSRIIREQPFTVVGFPLRIGAVRTDRFGGWPPGGPGSATDYITLERTGDTATIELLIRNDRITRNWNPIAAEHRDQGKIIETLYEPLVRHPSDSPDPIAWLARAISWDERPSTTVATVQLRQTPWHDGEVVTADDVEFTFRFLKDTSLGEFDTAVPTSWRRGRVSLVDSVDVHTDDKLEIGFTTPNQTLAYRALSVPILPKHIWENRSGSAEVAGIDFIGQTTEALVDSNEDPVGSGPLQFDGATADESLSLLEFPDHFLYSGDIEGIPDRFVGGMPFDRAAFTVAPSHNAAVELLSNDDADAVADGLQAAVVPRIVRSPEVDLTVREGAPYYHIGYNCREAPMTDPHFRRIVARHIDREFLIAESFEGYGVPSEIPLKERWAPSSLAWDGQPELPFFGENGDFDVASAKNTFREAGYQYEDSELVRRGET